MKKRGQVSPIVIAAIIVVIGIVLVLVIRNYLLEATFEEQYERHIKVPQQVRPVVKYMDECVLDIAQEGADLLGQQGGHIYLPYEPTPSTYVPTTNSFEIFPNSGIRTSLWFREKANGVKVTQIPKLKDMENELKIYITDNIGRCINNLTAFSNQGYTIKFQGEPDANVEILDNSIDIILNYPMEISIEDLEYPINEFLAQVPISLGKLYKISKKIMEAENEKLFLENQAIDQLVAYEEIPYSGIDLSCTPKIWSKSETKQKIKEVLSYNTQMIRLKGTSYTLPNEQHKYFEFDAGINNPEIKANFLYSPSWPTLIDVSPSSGDLMKGSKISDETENLYLSTLATLFCFTDHHFVYDIKYPVLISLTDPSGYMFRFGTLVIVDNNQPRQNNQEQLSYNEPAFSACDYPSTDIKISTYSPNEESALTPLEGAKIFVKCFPDTCEIGETKLTNGEALLRTKVPACANAVIEARKNGYYPGKIISNTNEPRENTIPIVLEPFYEKEVNVKIVDKESGEIREPYDSETIIFKFGHKEKDYTTSVTTPIEEPAKLIIGNYEITSYVIGESTWPITFPEQKIDHCVEIQKGGLIGFLQGEEERCFETEIPSVEMESAIKGGVKFDYTFSRKDLASEKPLTLYTIAEPIPSDLQGLTNIYESIESNKNLPIFRYPEI